MLDDAASSAVVFSHPNHELAIFGLLQRLRPRIFYLTDGGGEARVEQTRQGLRSVGLLDRAHFLNYTEKSFYEALVACDLVFFRGVVARLRALFQTLQPRQVLCDAVEFYNPVHDLSLPIVRATLRGSPTVSIFEVPLVHQQQEDAETYAVQRMSGAWRDGQVEYRLSERELAEKANARDRIYTILREQMGSTLMDLPLADLSLEAIAPARAPLPTPGVDGVLRYEWRAQLLLERGEIERKITYAQHYLPVAASLLSGSDDSGVLSTPS